MCACVGEQSWAADSQHLHRHPWPSPAESAGPRWSIRPRLLAVLRELSWSTTAARSCVHRSCPTTTVFSINLQFLQLHSHNYRQLFIDIRLCHGITRQWVLAVHGMGQLPPFGVAPTTAKRDVIDKTEVHSVVQCLCRRTEPWPQAICTQNFVPIGPVVPEICSWTDRQTDTEAGWSQYSAPLPDE